MNDKCCCNYVFPKNYIYESFIFISTIRKRVFEQKGFFFQIVIKRKLFVIESAFDLKVVAYVFFKILSIKQNIRELCFNYIKMFNQILKFKRCLIIMQSLYACFAWICVCAIISRYLIMLV